MSIGRIVRNTLVRRLTVIALAALLAYIGVGDASAQATMSKEEAYAACKTFMDAQSRPPEQKRCNDLGDATKKFRYEYLGSGIWQGTTYVWPYYGCPTGETWNATTHTCNRPCDTSDPPLGSTTLLVPAGTSANPWANAPSAVCDDGCEYWGDSEQGETFMVDGQGYISYPSMVAQGITCAAGTGSSVTAPSDGDGDGVSDGSDAAPNNPGQSGGGSTPPDGGAPPTGDGNGDGDGSGNGNQSTGGGNCSTPPNSVGDQIAAQTAYQTWATRCAIEKVSAGGKIKVEGITGGGTVGGGTAGNGACADGEVNTMLCAMKQGIDSIKKFFSDLGTEAGTLDTSEGETEEPESVWADQGGESLDLDTGAFGLAGGTCPAPPTYMGHSLDLGGNMCLFATIIGAIVLVAAYAQAAYIIGRE